MNVWMKRGLQTALFTGGLLAAGTGLASADETAVAVTAPVTVTDNTLALLGTAPGSTPAEIELPAIGGTVAADVGGVSVAVPITIGGNAADAGGLDVAQPSAAPASGGSAGSAVDADVPVTVTGNAVAVLGSATAAGAPPADGGAAAQPGGDASLVGVDVPVLVCGNAVAVLGDAGASCTAPAPVAGGSTDGVGVVVPVLVCGNAVAVLGDAGASCAAPAPVAGGSADGVGVEAPVTVCGNAVGVLGGASATCTGPAAPVTPATPTSGRPGASVGLVPAGATGSPRDGLSGGAAVLSSAAGTDATLAYTGTAIIRALLGGLLAFVLGLGLTVLGRRRAHGLG
ncbi:hypothetical protein [Blastococcus saxobsidens]|uniref:Small secreted domain DUF320 n=1 Tax=Blastococcus saxobsidens TaxID=138336 RepID=A0A4Q7Y7G1_9ACTN|nr:hypothetical protein [Blastococcus saxobsidens]RZU32504.1 hypothetical protein BKA19_2199 [Blastococcus saxobsidens]